MTHDTPPKRIWADPSETFDGMDVWRGEPGGKGVPYTLASEVDAMVAAALREQEQNYLHLHNAAFDVWRWFETARPYLIGPRAEKLRDALMGPRPYGTADQPASAALDKLIAEAVKAETERCAKIAQQWLDTFGQVEIKHTPAREYACDAVADILDALRAAKGEAK